MNFTEISTVDDLVKENNKESLYEIAGKAAGELTFAEGKALALYLINCLGSMHDDNVKIRLESGNLEEAMVWAKDEQKLHSAWDLIDSVEVD